LISVQRAWRDSTEIDVLQHAYRKPQQRGTEEIKQKLSGLGLEVQTSTPQEFHDRQLRDIVSFTASMKAAGFQPE
jgi:hypothetical protein